MSHLAYLLEWHLFRDGPAGPVSRIVEVPGWRDHVRLCHVWPPFRPPKPVSFDTNFSLLVDVPDYPSNSARWPVMSLRMLEVLLSVREFAYHPVPVILVQDTVPVEIRYDAQGRPKPEYSRSDYVAVQLASYCEAFDAERSVCEPYPWDPEGVGFVEKLVMRVPPEGLPPLFRIEECPTRLFVSAEARRALDAAGIRGPEYEAHEQR